MTIKKLALVFFELAFRQLLEVDHFVPIRITLPICRSVWSLGDVQRLEMPTAWEHDAEDIFDSQ